MYGLGRSWGLGKGNGLGRGKSWIWGRGRGLGRVWVKTKSYRFS